MTSGAILVCVTSGAILVCVTSGAILVCVTSGAILVCVTSGAILVCVTSGAILVCVTSGANRIHLSTARYYILMIFSELPFIRYVRKSPAHFLLNCRKKWDQWVFVKIKGHCRKTLII